MALLWHGAGTTPAHARRGEAGIRAGEAILRSELGARSAGLGGAYVAVDGGADMLRYNPAGLASLPRAEILLERQNLALDIDANQVAFAHPIGLGVSLSHIDYGSIRRTTTVDKFGQSQINFGANDLLVRVGYGREIRPRLALGVTAAYYKLQIDRYRSTGMSADLGVTYRTTRDGLVLAAAIRNVGQQSQFVAAREDLPLTLAAGAAWRFKDNFLLTAEVEGLRDRDPLLHLGAEFSPLTALALRMGYDARNEAGYGVTLGAGFSIRDLRIDYAFVPYGVVGESHRVGAVYGFGEARAPREEEVRPQREPAPRPPPTRKKSPPRSEAPPTESEPPAETPASPQPPTDIAQINAAARLALDGRLDAAEEKILPIAERSWDAAAWHATIVYMKKDWPRAAALLRSLTDRKPEYVDGWIRLGSAEYMQGRRAAAAKAWERALALDPGNDVAEANLRLVK